MRRVTAIASAVGIGAVGLATPALASATGAPAVQLHRAFPLRSVHTAEFGIAQPSGLSYIRDQGTVVVSGTRGSDVALGRLSRGEDLRGNTTLPAGDPSTLSYDARSQKLALLDGSDLLTVPSSHVTDARPPVARSALDDAELGKATGAAYDPSGALLVLDASGDDLTRIGAAAGGGEITRMPLDVPCADELRGVALNPIDGLTYVGCPSDQQLYGVDGTGAVRAEYALDGARLDDPQAFTFAPSSDPTDAPSTQSLFVADAGTAPNGGQVTEMALAAPAAAALTPEPTVLVQTIDTSLWTPGAPDTSGIAYEAGADRLMVSDSEVEEVTGAGYHGVNLWQATRAGAVTDTGTTYPAFSAEPTGLDHGASDNTLLVSDDNANAVTIVAAGLDGRHGTSDDVRTTMSTMPFSDDTEDVAYDTATGHMYIVDGVGREVYGIDPGPDGAFGDGDDVWSNFDVEQYGIVDPEGIGYDSANDSLLVVDQPSHGIYELTTSGALLRIFNLRSAPTLQASDIAIAPGSIRPERSNFWIVDRGVDNNQVPTENDGRIYELSVDTSGNTAPVVDAVKIDQQTPKTNDVLTATITAHDADNDPLAYRYVWRKNGTQIPGQTNPTLDLAVTGHGDKGDVISVRIVAFDGVIESAPRTSSQVPIIDSPPAFAQDLGDQTNLEGDVVSLAASATDPDGDPLTYEATGLPPDIGIDSGTGAITGSVAAGAAAGSPYRVAVSVRQGPTPDATDAFTWTVGAPPQNQPPIVDSVTIDQQVPKTNDTLTATVVAHDPDGTPLQTSFQWTRNGVDITDANVSSLDLATPGNGDRGDVIGVRVTVSDGDANTGPVLAAPVTIANTAPAFDHDLANRASVEGNAISLPATAMDADGDALTYGASGLPAGLAINTSTGLISGTVATGAAAASPYGVSITVNDGGPDTVDTFAWTVTELNPAPAAPSRLVATVTTRDVRLDWANNSEPDLAGYHVYRAASASGPFTKLNGSPLTLSRYVDGNAPLGTSYYQVKAVDSAGTPSQPATVSVTRRIAFRAVASTTGRDTTTVTVNRPTATAAGDLLVAAIAVRQTPTITPPSGWTLVRTDTITLTMRQAVYVRIATTAEPSSYRWTFTSRQSAVAVVVAYRGAAATSPVSASSGRANLPLPLMIANGVTTSVPGSLLIGVFGGTTDASVAPPLGMLEVAEERQSGGQSRLVLEVSDSIAPAAGATGPRIALANAFRLNIGQLVAVRPSA